MKTKILLRALSLLLVLCSIISIFPVSAFATHEHASDPLSHCIEENCGINNLSIAEEKSSGVMTAISICYLKKDNKRNKKLAVYEKEIVTKAICVIIGHEPSDWYVTEEATCLTSGKKVQSCTKCGATMGSATIAPLGHSMKPSGSQAPTCTSVGYIIRSCKRCPYSEKSEEIPATGHVSGGWYVTEEATCLTSGKKVQSCTKCGATMGSATIAPLGHSLGDYVIIKEATCTQTGKEAQICSSCNEQFNTRNIVKLPHDTYTLEKRIELGMCEVEYRTEKKCRNCPTEFGALIYRATEHTPGETKVIGATCETDGVIQRFCKECNLLYLTTPGDPAFGHSLGDYVIIKEATCTQTGKETQICSTCNGQFNTRSIAKLPHDTYTLERRIELEMCEVEYRTEKKCRNCPTEFGALIYRATEHAFGMPSIKAPTCTEDGYSIRSCKHCPFEARTPGEPALGHDFGETRRVEPTCDKDGYIESFCANCSKWIEVEDLIVRPPHDTYTFCEREEKEDCLVIYKKWARCRNCLWKSSYCVVYKATEHKPGETKVVAPTCEKDGEIQTYCEECGLKYLTMPGTLATGHVMRDTIVSEVTPATCVSNGSVWGPCAECGDVFEEIIPHTAFAHMDGWIRLGNSFRCDECPTGEFQFRHVTDLMTESEQVEFIKEWVWHIADNFTVEDRKGDCSGVVDYLQGYKVMTVTLPCDSNTAGSEGKILPWTLETDAMADFLEEMHKKYLLEATTAGIDYVLSKADIIGLAGILGDVNEMWKDFTKWNEIRKYGTELAELSSKIVFDGDMYLEEKITLVYVYREQFDENHQGYGWIYCGSRNVVSPTTTIRVSSGSNYYGWEFIQHDQYIDISDEQFYQDCIAAYEDGRCAEYLVQHVNYTDENGVVRVATPSNIQQMMEIFPGYFMIPNY